MDKSWGSCTGSAQNAKMSWQRRKQNTVRAGVAGSRLDAIRFCPGSGFI